MSAELAAAALERLRYPTELRQRVVRIVRGHMLDPGRADAVRARRLLAALRRRPRRSTCSTTRRADLLGKGPANEKDLERLRAFRTVVEREQTSPHRLRDLAIDGDDLIALGYKPGPAIGHTLQALLDEVVREPAANTRDHLLQRAKELA